MEENKARDYLEYHFGLTLSEQEFPEITNLVLFWSQGAQTARTLLYLLTRFLPSYLLQVRPFWSFRGVGGTGCIGVQDLLQESIICCIRAPIIMKRLAQSYTGYLQQKPS